MDTIKLEVILTEKVKEKGVASIIADYVADLECQEIIDIPRYSYWMKRELLEPFERRWWNIVSSEEDLPLSFLRRYFRDFQWHKLSTKYDLSFDFLVSLGSGFIFTGNQFHENVALHFENELEHLSFVNYNLNNRNIILTEKQLRRWGHLVNLAEMVEHQPHFPTDMFYPRQKEMFGKYHSGWVYMRDISFIYKLDYSKCLVKNLREMCYKVGVKSPSKMKKQHLIDALNEKKEKYYAKNQ